MKVRRKKKRQTIIETMVNEHQLWLSTKGKMVEVKNFDKNYWIECTKGIHFFMTEEEAQRY